MPRSTPTHCASCGDPLQPRRIFVGFIGSLDLHVCEACACYHSAGQFVLYQIATARLIVRQHQARLNAPAVR